EADVVAIAGILRSGIAKADDEQHCNLRSAGAREALLLFGAGRRLRASRSTARRSSAFASRGTLGGCTFRRRLGSGLGGSSGFGGGTQLFLDAGRRGDCRDGEV